MQDQGKRLLLAVALALGVMLVLWPPGYEPPLPAPSPPPAEEKDANYS